METSHRIVLFNLHFGAGAWRIDHSLISVATVVDDERRVTRNATDLMRRYVLT